MKTAITVATLAFLAITNTPAIAESGHMDMKHGAGMSHDAGQPMAKMSEGTVKKVDKAAGKITIAHGPLENLNMPGMTMAFAVKDKAMLDQVKPGDKIRFVAMDMGGALTVSSLENAK